MTPMTEPVSFDVLIERDLNILLLEETRLSPAFQNWLVEKLTNGNTHLKRFISTTHLAAHAEMGTVDILFLFENDKNKRCAFLIENKMDRPQEPVVARRYFDFGERGVYDGTWDEYLTCLIAPQDYFENLSETEYFSSYLSYEELADWFVEARHVDSSIPPHRAEYKEQLVRYAIQQWHNIMSGLAPVRLAKHAPHPIAPPVPPRSVAARHAEAVPPASLHRNPDLSLEPPAFPAPFADVPHAPQDAFMPPHAAATDPVFAPQEMMPQQSMPPVLPAMQQPVPVPQPVPAAPVAAGTEIYQTPVAQAAMPAELATTFTGGNSAEKDGEKTSKASDFSDFKLFPGGMLNLPPDYDEKNDSVMNVFTHDYKTLADETHANLRLQPVTPITEKEEVVEFLPTEFADGIKIVHRLRAGAVDLVFSGTPLSGIQAAYEPMNDSDITFKEAGNAAIVRIGVPLIDPQRGLESQKDLAGFALSKAQKLYTLYLRATGETPSQPSAPSEKKTATGKRLSDDDLFL